MKATVLRYFPQFDLEIQLILKNRQLTKQLVGCRFFAVKSLVFASPTSYD